MSPRVFVDVDVQHDFCDERGALRVPGSPNAVFQRLTAFAAERRIPILGSVDSHAWDAWEFASSEKRGPGGEDPKFPDHCVKGTAGWLKMPGTLPSRFRFVPDADGIDAGALVRELVTGATQGVYFEKEVYSLFANRVAEPLLRALADAIGGAPELFVYGVATDYCVRAAATGLAERGYRCTLLADAAAGITPEGISDAMAEMNRAGVRIGASAELLG
jgi:nicotinamidase/pyrazinamidase